MKARNQKQPQQPKQKPARESSKAAQVNSEAGRIQLVPLKQLHPSPLNARKKKSGALTIASLAASIEVEGLLQNPVVVDVSRGKTARFEVVAGERRLAALKLLAARGTIKADALIECRVVPIERATAVSLAENDMRENMHPADQFEAFATLVEEGLSEKEIAARFSVGLPVVRARLALSRVAPEVLALYRDDALTLEQVEAFTLTNDHDRQRGLLTNGRAPSAWEIRRQLTSEAVPSTDRRARYVGEKAYKAAGGAVRKDLFAAANQSGVYFEDAGLLERVALAKLDEEATPLRQTWAWVETRTEFDYSERSRFGSIPTIRMEPTPEQAEKIEQLRAAAQAATAARAALEDGPEGDDYDDRWTALSDAEDAAIEALDAAEAALQKPDEAVAALAGAVVTLGYNGAVEVYAGLVKPEDKARARKAETAAAIEAGSAPAPAEAPVAADPMALRTPLSALRTLAVQDALANNPDAALRVLAFTLLERFVSRFSYMAQGVGVGVTAEDKTEGTLLLAREVASDGPVLGLAAQRAEQWVALLPKDRDGLWRWCTAEASAEQITQALAFVVSRSVDGVQRFPNSTDPLAPLVALLGVDMRQHWTPTPAYFARIKKAETLAALAGDGKPDAALQNLKRDALAEVAAQRLAGTGWLPPTLRNVA